MSETDSYKRPLVIGLPGLLANNDKRGRVNSILEGLEVKGYKTLHIQYPNITIEGGRLICNFSVDETAQALKSQIDQFVTENPDVDLERIAFITSSMGTAFLSRYLARNEEIGMKVLAQISPLIRIHPETKRMVEAAYNAGLELDFSGENDTLKRIIPNPKIKDVLEVDALRDLRKISKKRLPLDSCFTFYGSRDDRADIKATQRYHSRAGGKREGIMSSPVGHNAPNLVNDLIANFIETKMPINLAVEYQL